MTQTYEIPSVAAGILQLARLKARLSQRELADRAGVPATMISAYERDLRQPTLPTLLRLLEAADFELKIQLVPLDPHDRILRQIDEARTPEERAAKERQQQVWRDAVPRPMPEPTTS